MTQTFEEQTERNRVEIEIDFDAQELAQDYLENGDAALAAFDFDACEPNYLIALAVLTAQKVASDRTGRPFVAHRAFIAGLVKRCTDHRIAQLAQLAADGDRAVADLAK